MAPVSAALLLTHIHMCHKSNYLANNYWEEEKNNPKMLNYKAEVICFPSIHLALDMLGNIFILTDCFKNYITIFTQTSDYVKESNNKKPPPLLLISMFICCDFFSYT